MTVITDVKEVIKDAKKKYDKDKYILVLEDQIVKLENEIGRLATTISRLEESKFLLNSDHLELFELFRNNNYKYSLDEIESFSKKSINLEIALSELLENDYFKIPSLYVVGSKIILSIPEAKKIEFLNSLKNHN